MYKKYVNGIFSRLGSGLKKKANDIDIFNFEISMTNDNISWYINYNPTTIYVNYTTNLGHPRPGENYNLCLKIRRRKNYITSPNVS